MPGGEAADNVAYACEAEVDQVAAAKTEEQPWSQSSTICSPRPPTCGLRQELSGSRRHSRTGARDVERAGSDAVSLAVEVGANVDQEDTAFSEP